MRFNGIKCLNMWKQCFFKCVFKLFWVYLCAWGFTKSSDLNPADLGYLLFLVSIFKGKETGSPIIYWSYLRGHLLRHVNLCLLVACIFLAAGSMGIDVLNLSLEFWHDIPFCPADPLLICWKHPVLAGPTVWGGSCWNLLICLWYFMVSYGIFRYVVTLYTAIWLCFEVFRQNKCKIVCWMCSRDMV